MPGLDQLRHHPALLAAQGAALTDLDHIPGVVLIGRVVRLELVGATDRPPVEPMLVDHLHRDDHRLIHF